MIRKVQVWTIDYKGPDGLPTKKEICVEHFEGVEDYLADKTYKDTVTAAYHSGDIEVTQSSFDALKGGYVAKPKQLVEV